MEQLVCHSAQALSLQRLCLHAGELRHACEATVEDNFSLWVVLGTLQLEILDLAGAFQLYQQSLNMHVHIAKNDSFEPLLVGQSQLLNCNLVFLRQTDGNQAEVLLVLVVHKSSHLYFLLW